MSLPRRPAKLICGGDLHSVALIMALVIFLPFSVVMIFPTAAPQGNWGGLPRVPCKRPIGQIKCGEPVQVVSRKGPFYRIKISDGSEAYISATSVSQSKKKFVAIDLPYEPWPNLADCSTFHEAQGGTHRPIPIYSPPAEYSAAARSKKISGSVQLLLTVGIDGLPHDIVVTKPLGYGLDENAVAALQKWKFDPAAKDGEPIPARIAVEIEFQNDSTVLHH